MRLRKEGLRCLPKRSTRPELEYWGDCMSAVNTKLLFINKLTAVLLQTLLLAVADGRVPGRGRDGCERR